MLSTNKLKKIKSNFPVLVRDNIVTKKICNLLIKEISNSKSFDDMIMGGRSRINKGSKNFNLYIKNSVNSAKLFKLFNSKSFYKKIENLFTKNFKDGSWVNLHKPKSFNPKKFTIKKKLNSNELKKMLKPLIKQCIKEVLFEEDGALSHIISEVAVGLSGTPKAVVKESNTRRPKKNNKGADELKQRKKKLLRCGRLLLNVILKV